MNTSYVGQQRGLVLATAQSPETKNKNSLVLALREAGSTQPKALALVLEKHEIVMDDALALISTKGQPAVINSLLEKGFKTEQVLTIYEVNEHYNIPFSLIGDFAEFFLGTDFSEEELVDAIATAEGFFPESWDKGKYSSGPMHYALGLGRSTEDNSLDSLAEREFRRNEKIPKEEQEDLSSNEGQGDFGD